MNYNETKDALGKVDIYLIDQILKDRYAPDDIILDAGCGGGRNLKWFYINNYKIYGIDVDEGQIENVKLNYPKYANNFQIGGLDELPYEDNEFNHIICNAVLHFATDEIHFFKMFAELIRVLRLQGTLFIRTASDIGLDGNVPYLTEKRTNRAGTFYITRDVIQKLIKNYNVVLIEPVKTTNVEDQRAMTTLVLKKM